MSDIDTDSKNLNVESSPRTSYNGVSFTEQDGKTARRKVDLFLVSTLTLYYFCSYLDRSNLGNAKVAGIEKALKMEGYDYNVAISIYFVPYILLELPATILLKKAGPHRMLPLLVGLWGIVTMAQGWVKSYGALLACRFLLGALESGLTPCSVVLMSCYIRRFNLQKRVAVFFAMISLAGAFAGLLAYAITRDLSNKHGLAGWQWIFILEGGATVGVALATFWLIPASPGTAWWLNQNQRAALLAGLEDDNTAYVEAKDERGLMEGFKAIWTNPAVPTYLPLNAASGFFTNGLPYFIPPIIKGLGYSNVRAQLFTVPPYALGFVMAGITSTIGDYTRMRTPMLTLGGLMGFLGYVCYFASNAVHVRYASIFLIVGGSGCLSASLSVWGLSNCSGHVRRATTIACGFMCSNSIALASVWAFRANQAANGYRTGSVLGFTAAGVILVAPGLTSLNLLKHNKNREKKMEQLAPGHVWPEGTVIDDRDIRFRYSY